MGAYVPLKNYFDEDLAKRLTELIKPYDPDFPAISFISAVSENAKSLELKARVRLIAEELNRSLSGEYPEQLATLLNILGPENESEQGMFTEGYFLMPVAYFVERYGLKHFDISMHALYEITKRHTSEYAVRPYLQEYPSESMELLQSWSKDSNFHIRRLVSEGTRPRLPWAKRMNVLGGDPLQNLALLEPLLEDSSKYVRRSVANHLNDLLKDHKQLTLQWLADRIQSGWKPDRSMLRHALRTLLKQQDQSAIAMLKEL